MIFDTKITSVYESEAEELLESVQDRFEYSTIEEATMTVIGEHEANWTKFMTGVGLSELATVMEGQEVIYEGTRLKNFMEKAKAFVKMAISKLAEITKSFITRIDQFLKGDAGFLKKYKAKLNGLTVDFKFNGYEFDSVLDITPKYSLKTAKEVRKDGSSVADNKDAYSRDEAVKDLLHGNNIKYSGSADSFKKDLHEYFYGGDKKDLTITNVKKYVTIIENTKNLKAEAKKSYSAAHKSLKEIIKNLEKAEREAFKNKDDDLGTASKYANSVSILLGYWKAFSNASIALHGEYMAALGKRNRQARAICAKALNSAIQSKGKADREKLKTKNEGYVDTDAFLGAVEFI